MLDTKSLSVVNFSQKQSEVSLSIGSRTLLRDRVFMLEYVLPENVCFQEVLLDLPFFPRIPFSDICNMTSFLDTLKNY